MAAAGRGDGGGKHAADQPLPADAAAIRNILKTMGVEAHEPRVMNQLLDFMYSYVSGVLSDASAFAEQVGMLCLCRLGLQPSVCTQVRVQYCVLMCQHRLLSMC